MTPNEYQRLAERTCAPLNRYDTLLMATLGLAGESGEIVEHVKKARFHAHPLNVEEIFAEVGDLIWYASTLCSALDFSLEDVMEGNIKKLEARYPGGFSAERSLNRSEA